MYFCENDTLAPEKIPCAPPRQRNDVICLNFQIYGALIFAQNAFGRVDSMVFPERRTVGHVRVHLFAVAAVLAPYKRQKSTDPRTDLHAATAVRRVL